MKRINLFFVILFSCLLCSLNSKAQQGNQVKIIDKVVLDAGHGGYDSGARGKKSFEKNIVLTLVLKIGRLIEDNMPDVQVIYTRKTDTFVELHRRAQIANENEADLFISVHCNSNTSPKPFGAETYVMGIHKSLENLEVAKKENSAILMEENYQEKYDGFNPNLDEDYIMLNMFQSAHIEQSLNFSMEIQSQLKNVAKLYDRGVKQAGFVVLYLTTMPGVLIETGFLSNPAEEKFLMKEENQDKIAKAVFDAFRNYKSELDAEILSVTNPETWVKESGLSSEECYRILFAVFSKPKKPKRRQFKELENIRCFQKDGKYYYTFGETDTEKEAVDLINRYISEKKLKNKFLKNVKIIKCRGYEIISESKIDLYLSNK